MIYIYIYIPYIIIYIYIILYSIHTVLKYSSLSKMKLLSSAEVSYNLNYF